MFLIIALAVLVPVAEPTDDDVALETPDAMPMPTAAPVVTAAA